MNENIKSVPIMSNTDLIDWLRALSNGYVKPDLTKGDSSNTTGIVRETKNYIPFIMLINTELCRRAGLDCPDIEGFKNFK